jgi:hypothetical protein
MRKSSLSPGAEMVATKGMEEGEGNIVMHCGPWFRSFEAKVTRMTEQVPCITF